MIKVLEHGTRKVTCPICNAKLEYEQEDVHIEKRLGGSSWIICPDCGSRIIIRKPSVLSTLIDELDAELR